VDLLLARFRVCSASWSNVYLCPSAKTRDPNSGGKVKVFPGKRAPAFSLPCLPAPRSMVCTFPFCVHRFIRWVSLVTFTFFPLLVIQWILSSRRWAFIATVFIL
jgi:hypothetical protein